MTDSSNPNQPEQWQAEVSFSIAEITALIETQTSLKVSSIKLIGEGWDNFAYEINRHWIFRFPRRLFALAGVRREIAILPALAEAISLPIPAPKFVGTITGTDNWPFFGYKRVRGQESCNLNLTSTARLAIAKPVAEFLRALHSPDYLARWQPLFEIEPVNRLFMNNLYPKTLESLAKLKASGLVENTSQWEDLVIDTQEIKTRQYQTIVHGDLHFRHLLLNRQRQLSGIIDWGDMQINDPALDLQLYWSFFPAQARRIFQEHYQPFSSDQLKIARVVAIFLSATLAVYGEKIAAPAIKREALQGLNYIASED